MHSVIITKRVRDLLPGDVMLCFPFSATPDSKVTQHLDVIDLTLLVLYSTERPESGHYAPNDSDLDRGVVYFVDIHYYDSYYGRVERTVSYSNDYVDVITRS